jgi:phospholipase/carboxylesterase
MDGIIVETGSSPTGSIIWLHGLGADAHDFEPVVPELVGPDTPALRFVFPNAPTRPVTINGGMRMRAWYDISRLDLDRSQDEAGIRMSRDLVWQLIAQEVARGVSVERIFLAGFSQGGAIVLAAGLTHDSQLGGLIALSAYVPVPNMMDRERTVAAAAVPIFMGHGSVDPVVPLELGLSSRDWLVQRGYAVDWHTYPMPHSVSADEIRDLRLWLATRLS